jgi:thioesterase domain-containing protein
MEQILPGEWVERLDRLWGEGIPLAGAMQVEIRHVDETCLQLAAPLAPNRNHMGNAFGGSLQGLAILAGWAVTLMASGRPDSAHVVIKEARMRFLAPVTGELVAEAAMPAPGAVTAFRSELAARGRARLPAAVEIRGESDSAAARLEGEFVAFERPSVNRP